LIDRLSLKEMLAALAAKKAKNTFLSFFLMNLQVELRGEL
jgi:hypothetical protein